MRLNGNILCLNPLIPPKDILKSPFLRLTCLQYENSNVSGTILSTDIFPSK